MIFCGRVERRLPLELGLALRRLRVAHALVEDDAARLPVGRDRVEQRDQVRGADDVHRRRVEVRREGDARERRVAAVRAAHDPDALRVGDALGHEVLHAPGDVVLHLVAPLLVAGVEELLAVAGGAAEVGLQDRVAAVGEELGEVVEAPAVARPGAAVRQDDRGQVLRGHALRQREEGRDLEPVRGRVAHGLHLRHVLARDPLADLVLQGQLLGRPVEEVALAGVGVARGGDQHDPVVGGGRAEADVLARELALEQLVVRLPRLVAEVEARPLVLVGGPDELVRGLGEDRPAEVHPVHRVGLDQLLLARSRGRRARGASRSASPLFVCM